MIVVLVCLQGAQAPSSAALGSMPPDGANEQGRLLLHCYYFNAMCAGGRNEHYQ